MSKKGGEKNLNNGIKAIPWRERSTEQPTSDSWVKTRGQPRRVGRRNQNSDGKEGQGIWAKEQEAREQYRSITDIK